jgi:hypothetical protein
MYYRETQYGFEWGAANVQRCFSDDKKGWVAFLVRTPKHKNGLQIYVTKTGKVRVFDGETEWKPTAKKGI